MTKTFTAAGLASALKEIVGHTGDLNIVVEGKRVESITVNDNNEIEFKLVEQYEVIDDGRFVEVKGEGLELRYIKLYGDDSGKFLNISSGQVGDTYLQPSKGRADYWIKVGRGKVPAKVEAAIAAAEAFLTTKRFYIEAHKPAYRLR